MSEVLPNEKVINDFSITVATVNGSGSATSNLTILRAIFRMGIPVSGKNLFPSNIKGMPTWFTIRVSKDGYTARKDEEDIVIAMNAQSVSEDYQRVRPGGVFIYSDSLKVDLNRDDIAVYPIPVKKIIKETNSPTKLRNYMENMVYVGVIAGLLKIDFAMIKLALDFHFEGKDDAVKLNLDVIEYSAKWTAENIEKIDPFYLEELDLTSNMIMADGNTSGALGSIFGGVQLCSWYPITPATSLVEQMNEYIGQLRDRPEEEGKTYAVVQTEDELAAIGMAIGGGWAGLRAMTSTSGPGISLMTEFIGLAYYSEVPVVIWNVQRVGPSTGMPTRTAQGDIISTYFLGHGDTQHVMLFPSTPAECFEFGWRSFDVAERLQTPVFVMIDLDIGMNQWISEKYNYPDVDMDRGKVLWEEEFKNFPEKWGRYLDIDGDGITYRTIPGNREIHSAYFSRGTGHEKYAAYTERPEYWEENMARLVKKFELGKKYLPKPVISTKPDAKIGVIAYGTTEPAVFEAVDILEKKGINVDYLRLRALPFIKEVEKFIDDHDHVYVVELNRDGQLHQIMLIEYSNKSDKFNSIVKHDGLSITAKVIYEAILAAEEKRHG